SGGDAGGGGAGQGGQGGGGGQGGAAGGGGAGGGITCNQAGSWHVEAYLDTAEYFTAVWGNPDDDGDVWAVGKGIDMKSVIARWNGTIWSTESTGAVGSVLNGVWASASGTVYAVGSGGSIYRYNGSSWSSFSGPPTSSNLNGIWGSDANHLWVVGDSGAAFYWDGADWVDHSMVSDVNNSIGALLSVWSADGETIWVTNSNSSSTNGYSLYRFFDGTWTAYANWTYFNQSVWGTANDDIWAVGYSKGTSAHFGGQSWISSNAPAAGSGYLNSVLGRGQDMVWAVGDGGQLDFWNGSEWSACTKITNYDLNGVAVTLTHTWAVGSGGIVLRNDPPAVP
ncbi:MAG TPA: hypothetical protein VJV78_06815, partial [Polyangiales bacterium]|nr:hypothetical protein [Polyangiales bacterium]